MRLTLALLFVTASTWGCKMDNPAFGLETESSGTRGTSDATGETISSTGTTTSATSQGSASDSQTSTTTTTGTSAETSPTSSATVGTSGTTGGQACGLVEGEQLRFSVSSDGTVITKCGANAVVTAGPISVIDANTFVLRDCDGSCDAVCQGIEYVLEYDGPVGFAPAMPPCGQVVIDQYNPVAVDQCEYSGIAIGGIPNGGGEPFLMYTAGHNVIAGVTGTGLELNPEKLAEPICDCPMDGCCVMSPGQYKLSFPQADGGLFLEQGQMADGVFFPVYGDALFDVANFNSHAHEVCDDFPHMDWVLRRVP